MAVPRLGSLPPALRKIVSTARALARKQGVRLFLVGGVVRDLLLERPVQDLDFTVAGDAFMFARDLAKKLDAHLRVYERFVTANLELSGGGRCDVAACRGEIYERPGALPRVRPGSITEDLARRDFTVNSMALELEPGRPRLLDPFGGRRDLASRTLRFLHPRSPSDDPTRAFRAARYANRLGFRVAPDSVRAIRSAVALGVFDAVSGDRLRREVHRVLSEPNPAGGVAWLGALGLVPVVAPSLTADARALGRLRRAGRLVGEGQARGSGHLFLLVWAAGLSGRELRALADRLALSGEDGRSLRMWAHTRRRLPRLRAERRPSRLRRLVSGLSDAEVGALTAGLDRRRAERLRATLSKSPRLSVRGRDLVSAGAPPGPGIGRALAATREALEDGMIRPDEELDFALRRALGRNRRP